MTNVFKLFGLSLFIILMLSFCTKEADLNKAQELITEDGIMQHIRALAHDSMMGRAPATEGERKTVEYLIREFEEMGLQGGMPDGGFIQEVPVVSQTTQPGSVMQITRGNQTLHRLNHFTDMMAWPAAGQEEVSIRDAELVYVGYGIVAPEEDWDDFKGQDMSGKILVFKNSDPYTYPEKFAGTARLYYGRWSYKYEIAQELGALGAIVMHTLPTAGYGWNVVSGSWARPRFALESEMADSETQLNAWLTHHYSREIFESAGLDLDEMMDAAESPDFEPVPLEGLRLSIDLKATYDSLTLKNVLALLPGNDDSLNDEYVIFSAHHDHLGSGMAVEGDSIFNGAVDNASGTGAMLEVARAFKSVQPHLRRNVLFTAVGGEESGLLGSRHLANNSPVPVGKISANFNLDSTNMAGETEDIIVVGKGRTTIDEYMLEEAEKVGRTVVPDQQPEQGFYYRSDHFSFARVGIPAYYPSAGVNYKGEADDYFQEVILPHRQYIYHTVHDETDKIMSMAGATADMRLLFNVAYRVVNADEMQQWLPGDEFEAARMKAIEEAN